MGYKLLMDIIRFDENKENYSFEEREQLEIALQKRSQKSIDALGNTIVKLFDSINDQE